MYSLFQKDTILNLLNKMVPINLNSNSNHFNKTQKLIFDVGFIFEGIFFSSKIYDFYWYFIKNSESLHIYITNKHKSHLAKKKIKNIFKLNTLFFKFTNFFYSRIKPISIIKKCLKERFLADKKTKIINYPISW